MSAKKTRGSMLLEAERELSDARLARRVAAKALSDASGRASFARGDRLRLQAWAAYSEPMPSARSLANAKAHERERGAIEAEARKAVDAAQEKLRIAQERYVDISREGS